MKTKSSHHAALRSFSRDLFLTLALRSVIRTATLWFFIWGVASIALRLFWPQKAFWIAQGLLVAIPLALFAIWRVRQQRAGLIKLRANYDRLNECGGLLMSEEQADMTPWLAKLPAPAAPKFRWQAGRSMGLLFLSLAFVATVLLVPNRIAAFSSHQSLEIGQTVEQLQAEIKTLDQEKIIEDKKAEELQKQLSQIQKDSSGNDPDKTWEALDHVKEADANAAKQAAEEILAKTATLTQSETIAQAMMQAADSGMNASTAAQAAQDLKSLLDSAKLQEGVLNAKLPPELLAQLNGLDKGQMQKLLDGLKFNKNSLASTLTKLSNLKMIDAATLAKCQNAGTCKNPGALAAYLSTYTNGGNCLAECMALGNGGPGGGGPEAPMTWTDGASEKDLKFQEHNLPPAANLSEAQLVGLSRAAPQANENAVAQHGALDNSTGSGGSAHTQVILPEHKQTVQNFFKRDQ